MVVSILHNVIYHLAYETNDCRTQKKTKLKRQSKTNEKEQQIIDYYRSIRLNQHLNINTKSSQFNFLFIHFQSTRNETKRLLKCRQPTIVQFPIKKKKIRKNFTFHFRNRMVNGDTTKQKQKLNQSTGKFIHSFKIPYRMETNDKK